MRSILPIILLGLMLVLACFVETIINATGFLTTLGIVCGASVICGVLLWIADNL